MYKLAIQYKEGTEFINNVSFENISINRVRHDDSIRQRDEINGNFIFWGEDYDSLLVQRDNDILKLNITLYLSDEILWDGVMDLLGEWDSLHKRCELGAETDDEYTIILNNIDREIGFTPNLGYQCTVTDTFAIEWALYQATPHTPFQIDGWTLKLGDEDYIATDFPLWDDSINYSKVESIKNELDEDADNHTGYFAPTTTTGGYVRSVGSIIWVCIKDNIDKQPDLNTDYWKQISFIDGTVKRYTCQASLMRFDDAIQYNGFTYWQIGSMVDTVRYYTFLANPLKFIIDSILLEIDSTITFDGFDLPFMGFGGPILYINPTDDVSRITFDEVVNIVMIIFNADWRIKDSKLEFYQPNQLNLDLPDTYVNEPNYYIDRNLNRDWSSSSFTDNPKKKIKVERWEIGSAPNDSEQAEFLSQTIEYDNGYTDELTHTNASVEVDFARLCAATGDNTPCLLSIIEGFVVNTVSDDTEAVLYNGDYNVRRLVEECWQYGRLYNNGTIATDRYFYKEDIELTKQYLYECNINIPYTRQDLIDFDYLIKTSFGLLRVNEISCNLQSASTLIKAAKQ